MNNSEFFRSDSTQTAGSRDTGNRVDHREKHERNDQHFERVEKCVAQPGDVGSRRSGRQTVSNADDDTESNRQ